MGAARKIYQIGPFRLDVFERTLVRDGEVVPLLGKAFDTLVALAEGAGTLQEQQALIDRIWPDVVVEPNSLQQNISLVRRALADARVAGVRVISSSCANARSLREATARGAAIECDEPRVKEDIEDTICGRNPKGSVRRRCSTSQTRPTTRSAQANDRRGYQREVDARSRSCLTSSRSQSRKTLTFR